MLGSRYCSVCLGFDFYYYAHFTVTALRYMLNAGGCAQCWGPISLSAPARFAELKPYITLCMHPAACSLYVQRAQRTLSLTHVGLKPQLRHRTHDRWVPRAPLSRQTSPASSVVTEQLVPPNRPSARPSDRVPPEARAAYTAAVRLVALPSGVAAKETTSNCTRKTGVVQMASVTQEMA